MKKNIWIINHYATNMYIDKNGRHYNFAKYLIKAGYNVKIICASTIHNSDKIIDLDDQLYKEDEIDGIKFCFIKARSYHGNGVNRVINMIDFYLNVKKYNKLKKDENVDVIYASSVHPLTCVAGLNIAKKRKIECINEIRDLWPESIVAYSSKFTENNPIIKMLYILEKWIYKHSDKLIFTIEGASEYIKDKGWEKKIDLNKIFHINNGVDIEDFNINRESNVLNLDNEYSNYFIATYTGSIRKVNDLGLILDAAKLIKNDEILINIWGAGNELDNLIKRTESEKITNVKFKGNVSKDKIPHILSKSNLNLLHSKSVSLTKYGSSQNKSFEYLAAGRPILSTINPRYDYIEENGAGISLKTQSAELLAANIEYFFNLSEQEYNRYCLCSKETSKKYDFRYLTDKLIKIIES